MNFLNNFFKSNKLIILDDLFPYLLSGFRIAEFNYYLDNLKNVEIYSTATDFDKYKLEYDATFSNFKDRVKKFDYSRKYSASLFYTIFLNNAYNFLDIFEKNKIPFVFTLYPGGGFWIDQKESDDKLRKVCASKYLKKIIVTQKNSFDYLIKNKFCSGDKIEFIYGGVLPSDYYESNSVSKKYYKKEKDTLDICFVANKYMDRGLDKGYDIFIDVAKILVKKAKNINFHVVGAYDESDIPADELTGRIKFYGLKYREFFPEFYSKMDIILSPNRPYVLMPGSFDGFPTGSCVEAGLSGVAVFCSDELNMNQKFTNKKDICIIPIDAERIVDKIMKFYSDTNKLYDLALNCQESFMEVFSINRQVGSRMVVLKKYL
ncbi:MAG: glycosyltransferase family 4 protein [Candidatus Moraniibacteriota bacterium]